MMKDDKLNQLFNEYAEEFTPVDGVTDKARAEMHKTHKKKRITKRLVSALACIIVICVTLAVVCPIVINQFGDKGSPPTSSAPDHGDWSGDATVEIVEYNRGAVRGEACAASDVMIDMENIVAKYAIVSEKYYACYYEDKLVYYIASFGILHENGIAEVSVIIEKDGYVRKDLKEDYDNYMTDSMVLRDSRDVTGEYVTKGYLQANGFHCYLEVMGNSSVVSDFAEYILEQI